VTRLKGLAVVFLLCGLTLAVGTPAYIVHAAPHLGAYLRHPIIYACQAVPYALCAALWLPWRAPVAAKIAVGLSLVMLAAACVLYVPMLLRPAARGGDMIALAFVGIAAVTTIAVLGLSGVAVAWRSLRSR